VKRDIALAPGWTFTGMVVGPDGKPLVGAVMAEDSKSMNTADFTVHRFNPRRPRPVFFRHPERGLIGVARPPKENGGTVTVRMEPGAAVMGRLVDADGTPRAGVELRVTFLPKEEPHWNESSLHDRINTDPDGRCRVDALLLGQQVVRVHSQSKIQVTQFRIAAYRVIREHHVPRRYNHEEGYFGTGAHLD